MADGLFSIVAFCSSIYPALKRPFVNSGLITITSHYRPIFGALVKIHTAQTFVHYLSTQTAPPPLFPLNFNTRTVLLLVFLLL